MDPIALILTAVVAGVVAASQDAQDEAQAFVRDEAVKEGYAALKGLILRKLGGKAKVAAALENVEERPDSEARRGVLKEELEAAGAGDDADVVRQAQALLDLLQAHGLGERAEQETAEAVAADLRGSGAIAQGSGAVAAGERGVAIGGSVQGSTIVTGDGNRVGGDQITYGDYVRGDKVAGDKIGVGDISNATGVAIGRGAPATVTTGLSGEEIARVFAPLARQVNAMPEGPDKADAQRAVQALEAEAQKGEGAQESAVRRWLAFLADAAPDAWEVAVGTFANPARGISPAFQKVAERARAERAR